MGRGRMEKRGDKREGIVVHLLTRDEIGISVSFGLGGEFEGLEPGVGFGSEGVSMGGRLGRRGRGEEDVHAKTSPRLSRNELW
jgi:hypothetical protein